MAIPGPPKYIVVKNVEHGKVWRSHQRPRYWSWLRQSRNDKGELVNGPLRKFHPMITLTDLRLIIAQEVGCQAHEVRVRPFQTKMRKTS